MRLSLLIKTLVITSLLGRELQQVRQITSGGLCEECMVGAAVQLKRQATTSHSACI